jgi:hypothetical protein
LGVQPEVASIYEAAVEKELDRRTNSFGQANVKLTISRQTVNGITVFDVQEVSKVGTSPTAGETWGNSRYTLDQLKAVYPIASSLQITKG